MDHDLYKYSLSDSDDLNRGNIVCLFLIQFGLDDRQMLLQYYKMSEQQNEKVEKIKIVMVGESGVGKTSILSRFIQSKFEKSSQPTLGACYISKFFKLNCGKNVEFQIWDTAGQQRYRSIAPIYYKQAKIALCVYDITSEHSFLSLKRWIQDIKENGPSDMIIMIVGNKIDKCDQEQIDYQKAKDYSLQIRSTLKIVSAKQNKNIEELFDVAGEMALKNKTVKASFIEPSEGRVKMNWNKEVSNLFCCKQ